MGVLLVHVVKLARRMAVASLILGSKGHLWVKLMMVVRPADLQQQLALGSLAF